MRTPSGTLRTGAVLWAMIATSWSGCRPSTSGVDHSVVPTGVKQTDATASGQDATHSEPWESAPADKGAIIDWGDEPRLMIGSRNTSRENIEYTISATLAVEEWESSERNKEKWERWRLTCSNYVVETHQRGDWCILERLVFVNVGGAFATGFHHMTEDRTLTITQVDWPNGILDLAIVNGVTTNIEMRFAFDDALMYLRSFKGLAVSKDPLTTFEYHIPEYAYVLNLPLEMRGWRSAGQKAWHEMFETLSPQDQQAWKALTPRKNEFPPDSRQRAMQAVNAEIPDHAAIEAGKRQPTAQEQKMIDRIGHESFLAAARDWLSKTSLSPEGQAKIVTYLAHVQ